MTSAGTVLGRRCATLCVVDEVGVRELRQNLSVWLRRVKDGESFRVTERGRPVALLTALAPGEDDLADLVAAGIVTPARNPAGPLPTPRDPLPGAPSVSEALRQLRDQEDH